MRSVARLRDMKKEEMFGGTRGAKPSDGAPQIDYKELEREVDQLEKDIKELHSRYELYFMGVEKVEPIPERDLIKSQLRRWKEMQVKNTALKFQIQGLKARMVSLENHWNRINRQKEEGTYRPDQERARRRVQERAMEEARKKKEDALAKGIKDRGETMVAAGSAASSDGRVITGAELHAGRSAADTQGRIPGKPSPNTTGDMARPSASSADDLTEPKLRKLYQTYVSARKRCGEAVDLRYEDMAAALRKQVPKLMTTTGAKAVEFKVVIRSGRAVLKAVPKH